VFVPWLPGLRDDLDSPTVGILDAIAPLDPHSFLGFTGSWALGHPSQGLHIFWGTGLEAVLLIGVAVGVAGLVFRLSSGRRRLAVAVQRDAVFLVALLAIATPVGMLVSSLLGDDLYVPRNLAVSWPAWSLCLAAVLTAGPRPVAVLATLLVVFAFTFGAARTMSDPWQRPDIEAASQFIEANTEASDPALDASPGPAFPSSPLAQTLSIHLPDDREVIPFAGPQNVTRAVGDAAGGRLAILAPPAALDLIAGTPELTGLDPVEETAVPGLFPMMVRIYEIPESP
jgi:hypothetical protein